MNEEKTKELVGIFRAWDKLDDIIDVDICPLKNEKSLRNREEVKDSLSEFLNNFQPSSKEEKYIQQKISASLRYIHELNSPTNNMPEYIQTTLGITPKKISESKIEQLKESQKEKLSKLGLKNFDEFLEKYKIKDKRKIKRELLKNKTKRISEAKKYLPFVKDINAKIEFVNEDVYWRNWLTVRENKFDLQINTNPKRIYWNLGKLEWLPAHEICGHITHISKLSERIKKGKINPASGLLSNFDSSMFLVEGIAQYVDYLLRPNYSVVGKISSERNQLKHYVYNNVHLDIENKNEEDLINYVKKHLPEEKESKIRSEIRDRKQNPKLKCYQYSYGRSFEFFIDDLFSKLNEREIRLKLSKLYSTIVTPQDLKNI